MSEEFNFSNKRPDELRASVIALTAFNKRSGNALKAAKEAFMHDRDGGSSENVSFAGMDAGEISVSKGTEGHYEVVDERAYGACLHDNEYLIPGGKSAAEDVWMPREEAKSQAYLRDMVEDHGGELPPGVVWKNGRAQTVTVRLQRGFVDKMFTTEITRQVFGMLSASPEEQ